MDDPGRVRLNHGDILLDDLTFITPRKIQARYLLPQEFAQRPPLLFTVEHEQSVLRNESLDLIVVSLVPYRVSVAHVRVHVMLLQDLVGMPERRLWQEPTTKVLV